MVGAVPGGWGEGVEVGHPCLQEVTVIVDVVSEVETYVVEF